MDTFWIGLLGAHLCSTRLIEWISEIGRTFSGYYTQQSRAEGVYPTKYKIILCFRSARMPNYICVSKLLQYFSAKQTNRKTEVRKKYCETQISVEKK